jgi:hypothetical protein
MKTTILSLILAGSAIAAEPALTIYNQNFAVVRDTVPLDLQAGVTPASFSGMTAMLEPDSVILRDPAGRAKFQIFEQSYRNDPVSQELLLSMFEGKTIEFFVKEPNKADQTVQGKIVRSGFKTGTQPVIDVNGKLQFALPGMPLFPSLGDDTVLNPTLSWKIEAAKPAKFDAELAYVTGGFSWEADYNIVAPEKGDIVDLVGWITIKNESGRTFNDARIKLMAGDVNKVQPVVTTAPMMRKAMAFAGAAEMEAPVTEKAFDEFHLYTLAHKTTLRDKETKQVEFARATGVTAKRIFVYDGATMNYGVWPMFRGSGDYGIPTNKKVWVLREFKNSKENNLGLPLPKGRLRFYTQDSADASLQFTGENNIDHTAKDETVRVYVGNSFDLTGERRRTDYKVNNSNDWMDEAFEIKVRNHKTEPVEIRVVEHLSRYDNWTMKEKSDEFRKLDSHTIEFPVTLKPDEEKIVTYRVHYTW